MLYYQYTKGLKLQVPLGGTFSDPGCFVQSNALGKASAITITTTLSGTAAPHTKRSPFECLQTPLIVPCPLLIT